MTATDSLSMSQAPAKRSLKSLAVRGVGWTLIEASTNAVFRLGGNLILTRLLFPEAFGMMSIVRIVTNGVNMFSDVGITASVVQNSRGDEPGFLNTAWTIQIARGVLVAIVTWLMAWPVASFYDKPILMPMIFIAGLTSVLEGCRSIKFSWSQRHLAVASVTIWRIATQIVSLSITVALAWYYRSVWALVFGSVVGSITSLVLSYTILSGPSSRWQWDRQAAREILHFGKWIFLASILTFIAAQADRIMLAKWISFETLGIYSIALMLIEMPRTVLKRVAGTVIFPVVSRRKELPREVLRQKVIFHRRIPVLGFGALSILFFAVGDQLILSLWDDRYADAAWMLPILGLSLWPSALTTTVSPVLTALGKPKYLTFALFVRCVHLGLALPLGFLTSGLIGVVVAVATIPVSSYFVICWALRRENVSTIQFDSISTAVFLLAVVGASFLRYWLGFGWPVKLVFG